MEFDWNKKIAHYSIELSKDDLLDIFNSLDKDDFIDLFVQYACQKTVDEKFIDRILQRLNELNL